MKVKTVMALVIAFIFMASVSVSAAPDMTYADSLKELKEQKVLEDVKKTASEKAKYRFEVTDQIKTDQKSTITVSTEKDKLKLKSNSGKHEVQNLQIAYSLLAPYIVDGAVRVEHKTDSGITDAVWIQKVRNDNGYVYFDSVPFSEIIIGGYTGTYAKTEIMNYSVSNVFNLGSSFRANSTNFLNAAVMPQYEEDSPYDIPMNGLVGWWKFDEGSGVNVTDSSGNGNHGTASGGMTWTDGKYNSAGSFDGVDDVVNFNTLNLSNNATFIFNVNVKSSPQDNRGIMGQFNSGVNGFSIGHFNGKLIGFVKDSSNYLYSSTINQNTDYWVCFKVEKISDTSSRLTFYRNGVYDQSSNNTVLLLASPEQFKIGNGDYYGFGNITIDNVIIYNRALSNDEIKQIYYDSLVDLQLKTNSNATYSDEIDGTGTVSIPYNAADADITSFTAYVPENVTIGGVTVRGYSKTVTPFTLTSAIGYTENTTLVSESIANGVYHLNMSFMPAGNSQGNLSHITAELGSYDWLGNIQLDSDDSEAMVSSWNATNFEIQTGNLTAGQTYEYNISVDVYNVPVAEFEVSSTVGYHTVTTAFTDLSTNSPTFWLWNFGDGSTSTSQNPTHTYAAGGYYTVTLTATNPAGNDVETKTNVIHVIPPVQDTIDSSFVDSWHDTISLIGVIIIVTLAGSAIMVFKGRKSMLDVEYDMQGIVLVLVLMVLGAIIFGQF